MDGKLFVLNEDFAQLQIQANEISNYLELNNVQRDLIFMKFEFEFLLESIKKFYNSIETNGNYIILAHEILDKKSIIEVLQNEIIVIEAECNMILPLLKRLFRNAIMIDA